MLPNFLVPSYKQYKSDSDSVATWLATTARRCGYPPDLLTAKACSSQKNPRLKGRARKLAREEANEKIGGIHNSTDCSRKYVISLDMFIPLSECIAESKKPIIEVPASFIEVLNRAIATRKRHSEWWNDQATEIKDTDIRTSIKKHNHFIRILEGVRSILRPKMAPKTQTSPSTVNSVQKSLDSKSDGIYVTNAFRALEVEEPADTASHPAIDALKATNIISQRRQSEEGTPEYIVKHESDTEDVYFAVRCLFDDLDNLRSYIQQVWTGYKTSAFELIPASIVTNTAIEFARLLQDDFCETFPQHTNFAKHVDVLYNSFCHAANQDPLSKELPDDEMNFAMYEHAEKIMLPAFVILSVFRCVVKPNGFPEFDPDGVGIYDATSDRKAKSNREKYREDRALLLELLPDFCVLVHKDFEPPAKDEVMRGVSEMVNEQDKGPVPIWLVFAAQIVLDIHHILRDQVNRGYEDLVRSAKYVENSIKNVLEFHKDIRVDFWPKSNDQRLLQTVDLITFWVKADAVAEIRSERLTTPALLMRSAFQLKPYKPFLLLKHHPIYCGLLSFSIKASWQGMGIDFANIWHSILCSAHLYNALRQEKLLSNVWQDMDLMLCMHRTEHIFVGKFPTCFDDYLKRWGLALGYSVRNFAMNKRSRGPKLSRTGPRRLGQLLPVSRMFKTRFCYNEKRLDLTPDDIDVILKQHANQDSENFNDEHSNQIQPKIDIKINENLGTMDHNLRSRYRHVKRSAASGVRPVQLLNALLNAIQSETRELTFDHLRLHIFCWRLLRNLQKAVEGDLRKCYGPNYLENEGQLPLVVGFIFMNIVESSKLAGNRSAKVDKNTGKNEILIKAAEVFKVMLESGAEETEVSML